MLLIKNAKLFTMEGEGYIEGGDVLIEGKKIVTVGSNLSAGDAQVIDAKGSYVMPGIVDAHCHIGLYEDTIGSAGADGNEATDPVTPHLRGIDAVNPADFSFKEAVEHGVTTVATGPGSANVIGGQFVAMHTYGKYVDEMIIKEPLALKTAFGENPKRVYGGKSRIPSTRMGTAAVFREAFIAAQDYARKMANEDESKRPDRDMKKEILAKALSGELLVKSHAHRADDIVTALRLGREFGLRQTIDHCTEGYLILDELKRYNAKCILGPLLSERSKIELGNMTFKAPAAFYKAGVPFALMTDHPVIPLHFLMVEAAICVREGLPEYEALKAITINAADVIGLSDQVGSLKAGKVADVVIYDGHPLDTRSHVTTVIASGEKVFER